MIKGQPNDFTIRVGIGKLVQNLAVAGADVLLLSVLFVAVEVPEMLWTWHVETDNSENQRNYRTGAPKMELHIWLIRQSFQVSWPPQFHRVSVGFFSCLQEILIGIALSRLRSSSQFDRPAKLSTFLRLHQTSSPWLCLLGSVGHTDSLYVHQTFDWRFAFKVGVRRKVHLVVKRPIADSSTRSHIVRNNRENEAIRFVNVIAHSHRGFWEISSDAYGD